MCARRLYWEYRSLVGSKSVETLCRGVGKTCQGLAGWGFLWLWGLSEAEVDVMCFR